MSKPTPPISVEMAKAGIDALKSAQATDDPPFFAVAKVFRAMCGAIVEPPLEGRLSVKVRGQVDADAPK